MKKLRVAGLHLWNVDVGVTALLITTRSRSPELAARKASAVVRRDGYKDEVSKIKYVGIIDA